MPDFWVDWEELWVPWEIEKERPKYRDGTPHRGFISYEIPDALVERFNAAKAEMEEVWGEVQELIREE